MNKNFTQDFQQPNTLAHLLIEEATSGQFVVFAHKEDIEEYGAKDASRTLDLKLGEKSTIALQLTKLLMSRGFALNSFREVARETKVTFSFADDTPGITEDGVAIHVRVDIIDKEALEREGALLVPFGEYAQRMTATLFGDRLIDLGVAKLAAESFRSHKS